MSSVVVMPRLSDSMDEGTIISWLKRVGDEVERGEPLVEIETDKAVAIFEAQESGTLLELLAPEGATVPLGAPIARIGTRAGRDAATASAAPAPAGGVQQAGRVAAIAAAPAPAASSAPHRRPPASPLARRIARELGLDLAGLVGSGPGGRIVKRDVEAAARNGAPAPEGAGAPAPEGAGAPAPPTEGEPAPPPEPPAAAPRLQPLSSLQRTVARRMAQAKATVPDFVLWSDVDMNACVELREQLRALSDRAPSLNDMVVKAAALALREHPRAGATFRDDAIELHDRVNVGIAVAAQDALVVPTIFDADRKSLAEIASETERLATAVRERTITAAELGGGTFTVSNLGMFGVDRFIAIVNPGQAAILSVGALAQRPAVDAEGRVVARRQLTLGLTCDHRVLYGADGARFLSRIRELLEHPVGLAL